MFASAMTMAVLLAACSPPGPGAAIVDRIMAANSPIVREVNFIPLNTLEGGPERIFIMVDENATESQQLDFWCAIAVLAGVGQLEPNTVQVWTATYPVSSGHYGAGHRVLRSPVCPAGASPSPSA